MEAWTETNHCESRLHCRACLSVGGFRQSVVDNYEWDGTCPHGFTVDSLPPPSDIRPKPCKNCQIITEPEDEKET